MAGRQLDDTAVQHLLAQVGGGAAPQSTSGIRPGTKIGGYDIKPSEWKDFSGDGVQLRFIDDRLNFISFDARFDGVLPLGLAWVDQRATIERKLGSPACCTAPDTPT